jgi:surface antigen
MNDAERALRYIFLAALASGCGGGVATEPIDQVGQAINVCDETVPEERYVDGLPAYAQCDAHAEDEIWSNNGIDTATSSQGADWVRTQRSGGYQCTELARRYLHFRWGIDYQNGNAGEWCDGDLPETLTISATPVHGDLIVFEGGVCGAAQSTGHIAVVDEVDAGQGEVTIIEQNRASRRTTDQSCGLCFLHAVANDGSVASGGTAGAGGGLGAGGMPGAGGVPSAGGAPQGGFPGVSGSAGAPAGMPGAGGNVSAGGSSGILAGGAAGNPGPGSVAGASTGTPPDPTDAASAHDDGYDTTVTGTCAFGTSGPGSSSSSLALLCISLGLVIGRRRATSQNAATRWQA